MPRLRQCRARYFLSLVRPIRARVAEQQRVARRSASNYNVEIIRALNDRDFTSRLESVLENLGAIGTNPAVGDRLIDLIDLACVPKAAGCCEKFFLGNARMFVQPGLQALPRVAEFPQFV